MIVADLLGPPRTLIDGAVAPPPLRWKKHLGLLILLWSSRNRQLSRDAALAMLWGDRPEHDARHSLNEALRVVRRHCDSDAIESDGDTIRWRGEIELDTDRFAGLEGGDATAAAALVRGEWCEGFTVPDAPEFERWLEDERRRWRPRIVSALSAAASVAGDRGELVTALQLAVRASSIDPLSEVAARAAVMARALGGDRSAALDEAAAFTERLRAELGVEPEADTVRLLKRVAVMRGGAPQWNLDGGPGAVPLVGRSEQLGALVDGMKAALGARRSAVLIVDGEPGSGRTRLLEEVALRARLDGMAVLTVRAVPTDADTADAGWWAIAGAGLADATGVAATPPEAIASLASGSAAWEEKFGSGTSGEDVQVASAVSAALRAAATERPVLIAVDDLDRFDTATIGRIPELLRQLADLPFVLAAVVQHGNNAPEIDNLRRMTASPMQGVSVTTGPLSAEALTSAVTTMLPDWTDPDRDRLVRRLLVESSGLPALAVGILEAVSQGLAIEELTGTWPTPDRTWDSTLPSTIPGALTAAVRLRFHQLSTEDRDLLLVIAVAAVPIDPARLATILEVARGELDQRLDRLEQLRWIVSDTRGYRFRAPAIGTLVSREMLTPGRRQRIEQRIGHGG